MSTDAQCLRDYSNNRPFVVTAARTRWSVADRRYWLRCDDIDVTRRLVADALRHKEIALPRIYQRGSDGTYTKVQL